MTPTERKTLAAEIINAHLAGRELRDCFCVTTEIIDTLLRATPYRDNKRLKTAINLQNAINATVDALIGAPRGTC